jgi:hypothetical protein
MCSEGLVCKNSRAVAENSGLRRYVKASTPDILESTNLHSVADSAIIERRALSD